MKIKRGWLSASLVAMALLLVVASAPALVTSEGPEGDLRRLSLDDLAAPSPAVRKMLSGRAAVRDVMWGVARSPVSAVDRHLAP